MAAMGVPAPYSTSAAGVEQMQIAAGARRAHVLRAVRLLRPMHTQEGPLVVSGPSLFHVVRVFCRVYRLSGASLGYGAGAYFWRASFSAAAGPEIWHVSQ